jgi:lipoate-protein ligase A
MGNKKHNAKSLHHGTILLNVNMNNMQRYLNPNKLKLISKGVDSVRSRVLNLNEKFPNLTKEIVFEAIEKEFLKYHRITNTSRVYIDDEESNNNSTIKDLYNYYNSWEWKFGICPEFTNSLSHKFEWGLIDLSLRVENGVIHESKIYSDTLHTEFVDIANSILERDGKKFNYDMNGVEGLIENLRTSGEQYHNFINEMKDILLKQI